MNEEEKFTASANFKSLDGCIEALENIPEAWSQRERIQMERYIARRMREHAEAINAACDRISGKLQMLVEVTHAE